MFTLYVLDGELFQDRGKPENRKNHLFLFSKLFPLISCSDLIILKFSLYTTLEDIEYHNPMLKTYMILSKCAPNLYNELDAHNCRLFFVLKT